MASIVHLDTTWQAVLERREYPPVLRGMLGELMAAAALLAASLKFSGSIILQMQGEGVGQAAGGGVHERFDHACDGALGR